MSVGNVQAHVGEARSDTTEGHNSEQGCWEYRDPSGHIRGPFSPTVMQAWLDGCQLPNSLEIRKHACDASCWASLLLMRVLRGGKPLLRPPLGPMEIEIAKACMAVAELGLGSEDILTNARTSAHVWNSHAREGLRKKDFVTARDYFARSVTWGQMADGLERGVSA